MRVRIKWWQRWEGATQYFRHLYPLLSPWRVRRLASLATEYWERPERFR